MVLPQQPHRLIDFCLERDLGNVNPADGCKLERPLERRIMTLNIRPLGDRILVEAVDAKEEKKGGIVIPDIAKEKPMECRVVALGTGKTDDNGKKVPFEMKKGDRLLVAKYGGTEVNLEGKEYRIFNSEDVLAVVD
jgi:chaperonin GroES